MFPENFHHWGFQMLALFFGFFFIFLYFRYPRFRRIDWRVILMLLTLTNFLDYVTTMLVVVNFGPQYEANDWFRAALYRGWHHFAFAKLIIVGSGIFIFAFLARRTPPLIALALMAAAMLVAASINNIIVFIRLSRLV